MLSVEPKAANTPKSIYPSPARERVMERGIQSFGLGVYKTADEYDLSSSELNALGSQGQNLIYMKPCLLRLNASSRYTTRETLTSLLLTKAAFISSKIQYKL